MRAKRSRNASSHLPVHGHAAAVEQAGARQQKAAGVERAQRSAGGIVLVQPAPQFARVVALGLDVGADDDAAERASSAMRAMGLHRDAVAVGHRGTVQRQQLPAVGRAQVAVGDAQRFDRRGQRDGRELRHQQEADRPGQLGPALCRCGCRHGRFKARSRVLSASF